MVTPAADGGHDRRWAEGLKSGSTAPVDGDTTGVAGVSQWWSQCQDRTGTVRPGPVGPDGTRRADQQSIPVHGPGSDGNSTALVGPQTSLDERTRRTAFASVVLFDDRTDGRFDRVSRLARRLFGVPIALVSLVDDSRPWSMSVDDVDIDLTSREISFCAHTSLGEGVMHVADATADPRFRDDPLVVGDAGIRFYAGAAIAGPGGAKVGTLCVLDRCPRDVSDADTTALNDLAAMVQGEIAAVHLAAVDELTGLSNRRGFEILGNQVLEICARQDVPATLAYFDIDGLKTINDHFGHDHGDQALRQFAAILQSTFRASDVIARLGGDEFAVLLTGTPTTVCVLDRLAAALDSHAATVPRTCPLKASVGSATFDPNAPDSLETLVANADAEMYTQKRRRHVST